jgi:hypothetical protein
VSLQDLTPELELVAPDTEFESEIDWRLLTKLE